MASRPALFSITRDLAIRHLRAAGWEDRHIGLVLAASPWASRRPRWLKPWLVAAVHLLKPKLGVDRTAEALGISGQSVLAWRKLPSPDLSGRARLAPRQALKRPIGPSPARLLELHEREGIGTRTLADHYGLHISTVRKRLRRARALVDGARRG